MDYLSDIVGKELKQFIKIHDYIQLVFDDYIVCVYNKFSMLEPKPGSILQSTTESLEHALFTFDDGNYIDVDLSRQGYIGNSPEAMQLNGPNNLTVVWND